jgi:4-hydroxybenzoate polyprenyltransferase
MFEDVDVGGWLIGWLLMSITLIAYFVWRSSSATVKRARRVTVVAAVTLGAATVSLAAAGLSSTMLPTALVCVAVLLIEGLASMVGAKAKSDHRDDAPSARAIMRDR